LIAGPAGQGCTAGRLKQAQADASEHAGRAAEQGAAASACIGRAAIAVAHPCRPAEPTLGLVCTAVQPGCVSEDERAAAGPRRAGGAHQGKRCWACGGGRSPRSGRCADVAGWAGVLQNNVRSGEEGVRRPPAALPRGCRRRCPAGRGGAAHAAYPPRPRLQHAPPRSVLAGVAGGVALQAALGAPFLAAHPRSYLARAFEFSRVRLL
jgi:hypothetical protein